MSRRLNKVVFRLFLFFWVESQDLLLEVLRLPEFFISSSDIEYFL